MRTRVRAGGPSGRLIDTWKQAEAFQNRHKDAAERQAEKKQKKEAKLLKRTR